MHVKMFLHAVDACPKKPQRTRRTQRFFSLPECLINISGFKKTFRISGYKKKKAGIG
jgi:hypothetical protein